MAHVKDLWTKPNPQGGRRIRTSRWGAGKRWQARWTENGKRVTKSFASRDAAELYIARVETGQSEGNWITKDKASITLRDLWEPWIASKATVSEKTRRDYVSTWRARVGPQWGRRLVRQITRAEVVSWLPTMTTMKGVPDGGVPRPVSASAQRKAGLLIHSMLDLAVELKVVHANPMRAGDLPPQGKSERRYLRVDEVDALLGAAPTVESRLLLRVLLMTGLRPGEAKALRVKDLDSVRGRLMVRRAVDDLGRVGPTKTGRHREVPIGGELLADLVAAAEGRPDDAWLVPDERGMVWTTARWRVVWGNLQIWTGIDGIDTYELRHTAASLAIAAGADVKTVQRMLGHASAAMTLDIYGHLWEEGLDAIPGAMEAHLARERQRIATVNEEKAQQDAKQRRARFRVL